jgi:hypothetical protein
MSLEEGVRQEAELGSQEERNVNFGSTNFDTASFARRPLPRVDTLEWLH